MIPPQILAIGAAGAVLAGFLGGWTVRDWKADAAAGKAATALIAEKDRTAGIVARHAGDFEAFRQSLEPARTESTNTIREVYRNVPVPADCAVRPDAASVLENARLRANAAASGRSGEPMPADRADARDRP